MKTSSAFVLAAIGAVTLSLAATSAHGAPDQHPAVPRQVQVKVEWVKTAPASTKTLTLAATEDQTGTVALQPGATSPEEASVTVRPHVQPDGSITVRLAVTCTDTNNARQSVSTTRTFKPGERLLLGGLASGVGGEQVFATASLVKASDDPFAAPSGRGGPAPMTSR